VTWEELASCGPEDFTLRTMPARFAERGDPHAAIDAHPGSLAALLELARRQEAAGLGDAPWPPHYAKQAGEPKRVQPSRVRPEPAGRRRSTKPLLEIGRARTRDDALAGLERWKARHPAAASHLEPADVLVDAMRGRFTTWTRIRVNLEHVPPALRPAQEPLDPADDPLNPAGARRRRSPPARRAE
jgi:bifunctional non-homologous end joining protein LigD